MQAPKNLWSLSTWMLRRILSVLSLFCQRVLGLHARQNLLHLITPIIVIIPTCLSLWCRQWPKACQCHHSTGKMNSHPSKPPKHISRIHRATAATTFKIICSKGMSSGITPTNSINFRPRKLGCCGLRIWPLLRLLAIQKFVLRCLWLLWVCFPIHNPATDNYLSGNLKAALD